MRREEIIRAGCGLNEGGVEGNRKGSKHGGRKEGGRERGEGGAWRSEGGGTEDGRKRGGEIQKGFNRRIEGGMIIFTAIFSQKEWCRYFSA